MPSLKKLNRQRIRFCKECDELYYTKGKTSKICPNCDCRPGTVRGTNLKIWREKMAKDLRTLKDLGKNPTEKELKKLGVEWYLDYKDNPVPPKARLQVRRAIKHLFNLTEEDVSQS